MINENNIVGKAEELKNVVVGTAESKINETKQNISEAIDDKKREAETKINETKNNIVAAIDDKKKQAEEKATEVKDTIASKIDNEKKFAENKVNEAKQAFTDKVNEAGNVVDGIRNAFAGKISNLASKISADDDKKA